MFRCGVCGDIYLNVAFSGEFEKLTLVDRKPICKRCVKNAKKEKS